ncbi:MAG: hypothetical protein CMK36_02735 [Porticoccaceae bacterium]|nr:hypothetical protein [Porticoccaceae bacterium]
MAYQESHWGAKATSPTGVRGLMMLTQDTAVEMKIQDRLDHSDHVWLALAAHNFGLRNIEDARASAQTANSDPDL